MAALIDVVTAPTMWNFQSGEFVQNAAVQMPEHTIGNDVKGAC